MSGRWADRSDQAYEHARSHVTEERAWTAGQHGSVFDGLIAGRYKGVIKEHAGYVRARCWTCRGAVQSDDREVFIWDTECIKFIAAYDRLRSSETRSLREIVWWDLYPGEGAAKYSKTEMVQLNDLLDSPQVPASEWLGDVALIQNGLIQQEKGPLTFVHQSLLTATFFKNESGHDVKYMTQQRGAAPLTPRTLLIVHQTSRLEEFQKLHDSLPEGCLTFPELREAIYCEGKVGDIRALDELAKYSKRWPYRPVTCDDAVDCALPGESVLKRSHSRASDHVYIKPPEAMLQERLACRRKRHVQIGPAERFRWFHQTFQEDLLVIGEFRVFITTDSDTEPRSTRCRRGVIREILHTVPSKMPGEFRVEVLSGDQHLRKLVFGRGTDLRLAEMKAFALHVFDGLRKRADWREHYGTLEVGVRLDIGVHCGGDKPTPYVNEITRIDKASFFSDWLSSPGLSMCRSVGASMQRVLLNKSR